MTLRERLTYCLQLLAAQDADLVALQARAQASFDEVGVRLLEIRSQRTLIERLLSEDEA